MSKRFGWYLDDGFFGDTTDTLDEAIQEGVEESAEDGNVSRVRVGEMWNITPSFLVELDDLENAVLDRYEGDKIHVPDVVRSLLELADSMVADMVQEGEVCTTVTDEAVADMRALLDRFVTESGGSVQIQPGAKEALAAWADKHIEPDPATYCEGKPALPRELIGGEWCVHSEGEPDAVITYATEPSPETGHVGWMWWAKGKMGDAKTYAEAKAAAEAALARIA